MGHHLLEWEDFVLYLILKSFRIHYFTFIVLGVKTFKK